MGTFPSPRWPSSAPSPALTPAILCRSSWNSAATEHCFLFAAVSAAAAACRSRKSAFIVANVSLTRSKSLGDDTFFSRSVISTSI